jgi:hypothetical protein
MRMRTTRIVAVACTALAGIAAVAIAYGARTSHVRKPQLKAFDNEIKVHAQEMLEEGREIFRYDTFGDEDFWGGTLRLHEAVATLSPADALGLGLKVDADSLTTEQLGLLKRGELDLDDPAVTLQLLRQNAVLGVTGFFDAKGQLTSVGLQCALCHSTVDDAATTGVGHRLDGWANRDLNVGAIIASAPDLSFIAGLLGVTQDDVRNLLNTWGPGKFDAELLLDGDTAGKPTLIPPAFGLAGFNQHTWTGAWGNVSYWNAFVANLELRGKGVFFDPRLDDPAQFPVAAANPELFGHKRDDVDLITSKLGPLQFYQLAIPAPAPPPGSFDEEAAERGDEIFSGKAACTSCHVEPIYTEPGWNLHPGSDLCIDNDQADRAPDHVYRTSPLNGLWTHTKGGFFHDGRFATLLDVVNHYNSCFTLGLTDQEKNDLVEYLKSLPDEDE